MRLTVVFILLFCLFVAPIGQAQKITIIVADNCGFVVKGKNVRLTASALPNPLTTIAGVQFDVDGANVGMNLVTAPYTLVWDSTTVTNGCHTINATATDSNNNTGLASVTVSVKN